MKKNENKQKILRGVQGAVFSKRVPLAAGGKKKGGNLWKKNTVHLKAYTEMC